MADLVIDSYQQYYFSGDQARVYFDGTYVLDINYIEYTIASNKAPIYSYNDPYYKLVAQGNYLVQGNFNINFTEREKLIKVMQDMKGGIPGGISTKGAVQKALEVDYKALRTTEGLLQFLDTANGPDTIALFNKYEDTYWGTTKPGPVRVRRMDEWDALPNGDIDPRGFDIVMVFGVPGGPANEFAMKQINRVHVTNNSMVTNADGNPQIEQFQFFAKNIDGDSSLFYPDTVESSMTSPSSKPPESKSSPPPEMRKPKEIGGIVLNVDSGSFRNWNAQGAPTWDAYFYFEAPEGIDIMNVTFDDNELRIRLDGNPDDISISRGGYTINKTAGTYPRFRIEVYDLPTAVEYVEVRNPRAWLLDGKDPTNTKFSTNFNGKLLVYRPDGLTDLPAKRTN